MPMISFVSLLFIIFPRGLHQVLKCECHQTIDFCNGKTKAIAAPILNFAFVFLYLFEETDKEFLKSIPT